MEPTKPKLPTEAIQLYNLFIHGEISRRAFMDGMQRFAVGGLTVAALVEALMPNYAAGQQVSRTDERIKAGYEAVPSPQGNGTIKGYLVRPVSADSRDAKPAKLPGILVVHENRGLNPHIEDVTRRFALAGFMAFAPDGLTSVGGFPGDDYRGGQMFSKIDGKKMFEDMAAAGQHPGDVGHRHDRAASHQPALPRLGRIELPARRAEILARQQSGPPRTAAGHQLGCAPVLPARDHQRSYCE